MKNKNTEKQEMHGNEMETGHRTENRNGNAIS